MMRPPAAGTTRTLHAPQNGIHRRKNTRSTTELPPQTKRRRKPQPSPPTCTTNSPPLSKRDSRCKLAIVPLHARNAHGGSQRSVQVRNKTYLTPVWKKRITVTTTTTVQECRHGWYNGIFGVQINDACPRKYAWKILHVQLQSRVRRQTAFGARSVSRLSGVVSARHAVQLLSPTRRQCPPESLPPHNTSVPTRTIPSPSALVEVLKSVSRSAHRLEKKIEGGAAKRHTHTHRRSVAVARAVMMRPPAAGTTRTLHAPQNGIHRRKNTRSTTELPPQTKRRRKPQPSPPTCTTNSPPLSKRDSRCKLAIVPLHARNAHGGSQRSVQVRNKTYLTPVWKKRITVTTTTTVQECRHGWYNGIFGVQINDACPRKYAWKILHVQLQSRVRRQTAFGARSVSRWQRCVKDVVGEAPLQTAGWSKVPCIELKYLSASSLEKCTTNSARDISLSGDDTFKEKDSQPRGDS
ncbi:hypothetical protein MOQ_003914, partial [Trypanosoma cruzi marinkellei]